MLSRMLIDGPLMAEQVKSSHPILKGEVRSTIKDRKLVSREHNGVVELATRHSRLLMPGAKTT